MEIKTFDTTPKEEIEYPCVRKLNVEGRNRGTEVLLFDYTCGVVVTASKNENPKYKLGQFRDDWNLTEFNSNVVNRKVVFE